MISVMLWTAKIAKQISVNILDSFKTVDNSLKTENDNLNKKNDSLLKNLPVDSLLKTLPNKK